MFQENCPLIIQERTIVLHILNRRDRHPQFKEAERTIRITWVLEHIKTLEERLLEEYVNVKPHNTKAVFLPTNGNRLQYCGIERGNNGWGRGTSWCQDIKCEINNSIKNESTETMDRVTKRAKPKEGHAKSAYSTEKNTLTLLSSYWTATHITDLLRMRPPMKNENPTH